MFEVINSSWTSVHRKDKSIIPLCLMTGISSKVLYYITQVELKTIEDIESAIVILLNKKDEERE